MAAQILIRDEWVPAPLQRVLKTYSPKSELGRIVRECLRYLPPELAGELVERVTSCVVMESQLELVVIRSPQSEFRVGRSLYEDYGVVSRKLVTNNGVAFIVDAFQNILEPEIMKYHGIGITNTAENVADSALASEITTQYNPDNTRATGTTEEGASANIFKTVATNTVDNTVAAVEHGVFSQAATGGGVLLDRSVFTVVNLAAADGLQSTYQLTFSAGG